MNEVLLFYIHALSFINWIWLLQSSVTVTESVCRRHTVLDHLRNLRKSLSILNLENQMPNVHYTYLKVAGN